MQIAYNKVRSATMQVVLCLFFEKCAELWDSEEQAARLYFFAFFEFPFWSLWFLLTSISLFGNPKKPTTIKI